MAILTFIPRWRKSIRNFLGVFLALLFAALVTPAWAQAMIKCFPRPLVVDKLLSDPNLALRFQGIDVSGDVLEFWVNAKTGAWVSLIARPNGLACPLTHGETWQDIPLPPMGTPS